MLGRPAPADQVRNQSPGAAVRAVGHDDVLAHRHAGKQLEPLESPADAEPGPTMHRQVRQGFAVEGHLAACRRQQTDDAVEERGLARAVRTDEADKLAAPHVQRHVVERADPAEVNGDRVDVKQRGH